MSDQWRRVNDIFHAALDRPEGERAALVAARAGADLHLRDEVLSLLEAHDRSGGFLDSPGPGAGTPGTGLTPGAQVGNYRIERELGRGGMGVVYLAEDLRLARKVALKALAPDCTGDERRRERLRKEARAAAQLSHPGIATVFALEEIGGDLYIAGEYVPGPTLREEIAAGPVAVDRLLLIAREVARALNAAHDQGVVHRDLKPENIICTGTTVKVLDFGIARSLAIDARSPEAGDQGPEGGDHVSRLTEAGTIVGTPGYMSPEQIEAREVDLRSDIFSFGVLLYEVATLVHPFEGTSAASTIARILTIEPCPPGELRPLPSQFDRIVRRCLHKRPEDRYQATAELVADLDRLAEQAEGRTPGPASGEAGSAASDLVPGRARLAAPQRKDRGPSGATRWWRVHQLSVVCVYALMSGLAGIVDQWIGRSWSTAVFFGCVAAAALNGTLRVHLLFTERHNLSAFRGELRRATSWLRGSDIAFGVGLLALALGVASSRTWPAIVFAAVGAGSLIVSVAVEPATTDAAFPRRLSGARRRTTPNEQLR